MNNFIIHINIPAKKLPLNANDLYFRDKTKSRVLTLAEFKDCVFRLRCYRENNLIKRNKDGEIIASFEMTDKKSNPFTVPFTTRWKKNNFLHKLRRKKIKLEIDVKYNELPLMTLRQAEKELIKRALLETNGSIKQSAALLDIASLTLQNKIRRYKLDK